MAWLLRLPVRLTAAIMAFGSGVLLSALSFDLMDEARQRGGLLATGAGFLVGAAVFTAVDALIARRGAKHRKRSGGQQSKEAQTEGSGVAIAVGALLDGIPESIVLGTTMLAGGRVSMVAVIAIFLSAGIAFVSGLASVLGFVAFRGAPPALVSVVTAIAAGAILAMLVDTLIPEAFAESHAAAGLVVVVGFLCAFILTNAEKATTKCPDRSVEAPAASPSSASVR